MYTDICMYLSLYHPYVRNYLNTYSIFQSLCKANTPLDLTPRICCSGPAVLVDSCVDRYTFFGTLLSLCSMLI